jgi:ssDNA-binding replication factor A large subunit
MINLPYNEIIEKIKEKSNINNEEIEKKVKQKMDQLSGLISKEGAAYIIANELGIKLMDTSNELKIKDICIGMRGVKTNGKIIRKFPVNEFERNGNKGRVLNLIIADETSNIRITAWHDMVDVFENTKEGDIVKIDGGFVKENLNQKEIHLNNQTKVIINPKDVKINVELTTTNFQDSNVQQKIRKKISELNENDFNIEIAGTILQAFEPKFFPTCPICNKKVNIQNNEYICSEHNKVEPKFGYVMNVVIDDGSDNIRAVFFRENVLKLINMTDEKILKYKEQPTEFEDIKTKLLGETILINGKITRNQMFDRLEILVNNIGEINLDYELKNAEKIKNQENSNKKKDDELPSIDEL